MKEAYQRLTGVRDVGVLPSLSCGIIAALTGQAVAFPAEVVSRRMAAGAKGGALAVLRGIVREKGVAALYTGLGAGSVRVVPMAFLSFGTYEVLRGIVDNAVSGDLTEGGDEEATS